MFFCLYIFYALEFRAIHLQIHFLKWFSFATGNLYWRCLPMFPSFSYIFVKVLSSYIVLMISEMLICICYWEFCLSPCLYNFSLNNFHSLLEFIQYSNSRRSFIDLIIFCTMFEIDFKLWFAFSVCICDFYFHKDKYFSTILGNCKSPC